MDAKNQTIFQILHKWIENGLDITLMDKKSDEYYTNGY